MIWRVLLGLVFAWRTFVVLLALALMVTCIQLAITEKNTNYLTGLVIIPAWLYWKWEDWRD